METAKTPPPSTQSAPATSSPSDSKGIGPISEVALGPIDAQVAAHGKTVFETKCSACHKWEERYVGPALNGVTQRRRPEWIMNMILNPDQMIQNDAQAKALFAQYLTPMTFQNVTKDDAAAILTYFRSLDAEDADDSEKSGESAHDSEHPGASD
jgi:mono/diheme cytochrome c family protein